MGLQKSRDLLQPITLSDMCRFQADVSDRSHVPLHSAVITSNVLKNDLSPRVPERR